MKRLQYPSLLSLLGITLLGFAANSTQAQVFSSNGQSGVYVQGNGHGMAGTFDDKGFHGIAVGPNGRMQRFDGRQPNPFVVGSQDGSGAFAGAMAGRAATGPGGFDPFAFVFGNKAMMGGSIGAMAGAMPPRDLTAAKRAFEQGRYADAMRMAERATADGVVDTEAEQVRALALFAMRKYDRAAGSAHTVLKAGAEWNWPTLQRMYPNRETYLQQLRALQATTAEPTASAATHFLLAYHCLMLNQVDAARGELTMIRQMQPENELVNELLASLPPSIVER